MLNQIPTPTDIEIVRGDSVKVTVHLETSGVPINVTGWTFTGELVTGSVTLPATTSVVDAVNGVVTYALTGNDTQRLRSGMWRLIATKPDGYKQTVAAGTIYGNDANDGCSCDCGTACDCALLTNPTITANVTNIQPYVLPPATNTTLGGVIIPDGGSLVVDSGGNLTVTGLGGNYVENKSQYGNLTVTDSVAFSGGLQCELSAPSFGEKVIHYALNGGARTDWLVNTTVEGSYYGASISGSAAGANFQKTTFSSYPNNATYTQIFLTDTDATLTLSKLGSSTAKTKVWTPNSILTQGYADTRYAPILPNTTSNSTIPIKSTTATNTVISGQSFLGSALGQPATAASGYTSGGAFIAEAYQGSDASTTTQFGILHVTRSSLNLFSRKTDGTDQYGLDASSSGTVGTRLINKVLGQGTGQLELKPSTTDYVAISNAGVTSAIHAGQGNPLSADSMNIGICANSTHGTAELRYGANLTAVHNANSILTQGYADTRYAPINVNGYIPMADLTGSGWQGKIFTGGVYGDSTANLVSGVVNNRGVKNWSTGFQNSTHFYEMRVAQASGVEIIGGLIAAPNYGRVSIIDGAITLQPGSGRGATLSWQGATPVWSNDSILNRSYADTRYLASFDKANTHLLNYTSVKAVGISDAQVTMATGQFIAPSGNVFSGAISDSLDGIYAASGMLAATSTSKPVPQLVMLKGADNARLEIDNADTTGGFDPVIMATRNGAFYQAKSDKEILTRGYADIRYQPRITVGQLQPVAGKIYLNSTTLKLDTYSTCLVTETVQLIHDTLLRDGDYYVRLINAGGHGISLGTGIELPSGFNTATDIGQTTGSVTILHFQMWDETDANPQLFLVGYKVF